MLKFIKKVFKKGSQEDQSSFEDDIIEQWDYNGRREPSKNEMLKIQGLLDKQRMMSNQRQQINTADTNTTEDELFSEIMGHYDSSEESNTSEVTESNEDAITEDFNLGESEDETDLSKFFSKDSLEKANIDLEKLKELSDSEAKAETQQDDADSEIKPSEEEITEDIITEDTISEDAISEDAISEDAISEDSISEDSISEDAITEEAITEDSIAEDSIAEDTIAEDTIAEDIIAEDTIAEDTIAEDTIAEDTIAEDTIAEDTEFSIDENEITMDDTSLEELAIINDNDSDSDEEVDLDIETSESETASSESYLDKEDMVAEDTIIDDDELIDDDYEDVNMPLDIAGDISINTDEMDAGDLYGSDSIDIEDDLVREMENDLSTDIMREIEEKNDEIIEHYESDDDFDIDDEDSGAIELNDDDDFDLYDDDNDDALDVSSLDEIDIDLDVSADSETSDEVYEIINEDTEINEKDVSQREDDFADVEMDSPDIEIADTENSAENQAVAEEEALSETMSEYTEKEIIKSESSFAQTIQSFNKEASDSIDKLLSAIRHRNHELIKQFSTILLESSKEKNIDYLAHYFDQIYKLSDLIKDETFPDDYNCDNLISEKIIISNENTLIQKTNEIAVIIDEFKPKIQEKRFSKDELAFMDTHLIKSKFIKIKKSERQKVKA